MLFVERHKNKHLDGLQKLNFYKNYYACIVFLAFIDYFCNENEIVENLAYF